MISPAMMNAVLAGLLSAACLSAFADPPRKHSAISTEETRSPAPSTLSVPTIEDNVAVGAEGEADEVSARSSANSMHSEINAKRGIADMDVVESSRKTSE